MLLPLPVYAVGLAFADGHVRVDLRAILEDESNRGIRSLATIDLLAIDEMGYLNVKPEQTNIFFKLMVGVNPFFEISQARPNVPIVPPSCIA